MKLTAIALALVLATTKAESEDQMQELLGPYFGDLQNPDNSTAE